MVRRVLLGLRRLVCGMTVRSHTAYSRAFVTYAQLSGHRKLHGAACVAGTLCVAWLSHTVCSRAFCGTQCELMRHLGNNRTFSSFFVVGMRVGLPYVVSYIKMFFFLQAHQLLKRLS